MQKNVKNEIQTSVWRNNQKMTFDPDSTRLRAEH